MPTYKLPKIKKEKKESKGIEAAASLSSEVDEYRRRITVPVNDAILDGMEMDDQVTITLVGRLSGMNKTISEHYKEKSITLEVAEVSAYSSEEMEDDGMSAGYEES